MLNASHSKDDNYEPLPLVSLRDIAGKVRYRQKGGKQSCMSVAGVWRIEKGGEVTLGVARALAGYFGKSVCEVWPDLDA
jgi:hypothetical protein